MPPGKTLLASSADRDKFPKISAEVGPAKVGREVLGPFVAQGGAARVCGDDVVDVNQNNQHLLAPEYAKEARVALGLGEAKRNEGLAGRLVPVTCVRRWVGLYVRLELVRCAAQSSAE
eukprot:6201252-Pleurochrysis_carterae.AAC.2